MLHLAMAAVVAGCSSDGAGPGATGSSPGTGSGQLALRITGAKSFNPTIPPGQIRNYEITVSGDGFEPVRATVAGDATEATVTGIPTGDHRRVQIVAQNPNGQKIREGEAADVVIPGDAVVEVPIAMEAVPVITNVADGAFVANTRLRFTIFSDPATVVELSSEKEAKTEVLTDMVENRPAVATDAATGLATFVPSKLAPGEYVLTVRDAKTGRKNVLPLTVTDGARERAAPLKSVAMPVKMVMRID